MSTGRYLLLERTPYLERVIDRYTGLVEYVLTPDVEARERIRDGGRFARGFVTEEAEARLPGAREHMLGQLARHLGIRPAEPRPPAAPHRIPRDAPTLAEPDAGAMWRRWLYGSSA